MCMHVTSHGAKLVYYNGNSRAVGSVLYIVLISLASGISLYDIYDYSCVQSYLIAEHFQGVQFSWVDDFHISVPFQL